MPRRNARPAVQLAEPALGCFSGCGRLALTRDGLDVLTGRWTFGLEEWVLDLECDVVIPTRDRPDVLERVVRALRAQTATTFGVVVVDDGSTPALDERMLEVHLGGVVPYRLVRLEGSGPAAARNAGAAVSTARFLAFLDDDTVPAPTWLETHLEAVRCPDPDGRVTVTCGPFVEPSDWTPTPWNLWEAKQAKKESDALVAGVWEPTWRQFHTGNNVLPTAMFRRLGGFDETFKRAEDDELALRLDKEGCRFIFLPDAVVWHYAHRTIASWLAIPRAYASYNVEIDRKFPDVGYLAAKRRELAERHAVVRAARRIAGGRVRTRLAAHACIGLARVAHPRCGRLSTGALSIAYDLLHCDTLRDIDAATC